MTEERVHLADGKMPEAEGAENQSPEGQSDGETLSWRLVGTLYNNLSIVVKLTVLGGIDAPSILFPGDLSDWTMLVSRQWGNLKAEVLKLPHHGSTRVGVDSTTLKGLMHDCIHCTPWHSRQGIFWWPRCGPWYSREEWRRFESVVKAPNGEDFLKHVVCASHALVFPYPAHKLPNMALGRICSDIVANRQDCMLSALSEETNAPRPARLRVGLERTDVHQVDT
jgi:hypothetical protein